MSHGKQFTLFSHKQSPNAWKVALVLEELGLTYETKYLDFRVGEHKRPDYTKINPNGRVPAIIDHQNNDFTLWDSGAIVNYLVTKYDPEHKISASTEEDTFLQSQWLSFQVADQAVYYGQAFYFSTFHPEKLPSAIERYKKEIIRVCGVLDGVLAKREWLVGDKPTVADLSFVPWNELANPEFLATPEGPFALEKAFPHYYAWNQKLRARPAATKARELQAEANKA